MLKKLHIKLVATFDKFYSIFFLYILFEFLISISSIGKNTLGHKLEIICGIICMISGIVGLIKSYKTKRKS